VLLASTALAPDRKESRPLLLKVLLDCSGSMQGASINAARKALLAILDRLTGDDHIALVRFGLHHEQVTDGLERADAHTLPGLKARVRGIEADLGGTEMARALAVTLAIPSKGGQADVLLITDGEIHAISQVVELAARSGQRLFTIAIGAAPVEALARELAQRTGGGCEFVAPGEDAEGAILRTFKRLRATPRSVAAVSWPATPAWVCPLPTAVFPGDTLHLMAGFTDKPRDAVRLTVRDADGGTQVITQEPEVEVTGDRIPRLAAARRLAQLPESEACALAVKHQLVSRYTSLVVVAVRAGHEKAGQLPEVIPVPHMLVDESELARPRSQPQRAPAAPSAQAAPLGGAHRRARPAPPAGSAPRPAAPRPVAPGEGAAAAALLRKIEARLRAGEALPVSLMDLEACDAPPAVIGELEELCRDTGESEGQVVRGFLAILAEELGADPALAAALAGDVLSRRRYRELRSRLVALVRRLILGG
jgi:Ca-activated chloride channel family protein